MSGLWSAPAWITASMPCSAKALSTSPRSATEPITPVSAPAATSRPITSCPRFLRRGARKRPSQPDEPVRRTRIGWCSGRGGDRGGVPLGGIERVGPFGAAAEPGIEEQQRQLEEQQLRMDEGVDRPLPPFRLAPPVRLQPALIRRPKSPPALSS